MNSSGEEVLAMVYTQCHDSEYDFLLHIAQKGRATLESVCALSGKLMQDPLVKQLAIAIAFAGLHKIASFPMELQSD